MAISTSGAAEDAIAGEVVTGAGFGAVEAVAVDVAVPQPIRVPGFHERSDEGDVPPDNAFSVRVLARGVLTRRTDRFLSPCDPTIED